jgi:uncharacterized protein YgiM (DUF1202 family)
MKSIFTRLALILTLLTVAAPAAHATADGPDFWRVHSVASWDVLNVRNGPGVSYDVIDALPYNARRVQVVSCLQVPTSRGLANWCLVNWNGYQRGWVNRRYLGEDY